MKKGLIKTILALTLAVSTIPTNSINQNTLQAQTVIPNKKKSEEPTNTKVGTFCKDITDQTELKDYQENFLYKFPANSNLNSYFPDGLEGNLVAEFGLLSKVPCDTEIYPQHKEEDNTFKKISAMDKNKLEHFARENNLEELSSLSLNHLALSTDSEKVYFEFFKRYYNIKELEKLHKGLHKEISNGGFGPRSHKIYQKIEEKEKGTKTKVEEAENLKNKMLTTIKEKNLFKEYSHFVNFAVSYELSYEQYSKVKALINKGEGNYKTKKVAGLEKVLEHESFIDQLSSYYNINKSRIVEVMQQESAFQIKAIGPLKERGLGQFKEPTARELARLIANEKSEVYYPHFKLKDYSFEKLSRDYELNIIMVAANTKLVLGSYNRELEKLGISKEQFLERVRRKGGRTDFSKLTKLEIPPYDKYSISPKRAKQANRFWKSANLVPDDLFYLVYNGGGGAIRSVLRNTPLSELLLYNLTVFLENKEKLSEYTNYHYGGIENLIQKNKKIIDQVEPGASIDLYGNLIYNVSLTKLKGYNEKGLITINISHLLDKNGIIVASNHKKDYAFENLRPCDIKKEEILVLKGLKIIDQLYEELALMHKLKNLQERLNQLSKNNEEHKQVVKEIQGIEEKLGREHTGITKVNEDIKSLEKEIKDYGFKAY